MFASIIVHLVSVSTIQPVTFGRFYTGVQKFASPNVFRMEKGGNEALMDHLSTTKIRLQNVKKNKTCSETKHPTIVCPDDPVPRILIYRSTAEELLQK